MNRSDERKQVGGSLRRNSGVTRPNEDGIDDESENEGLSAGDDESGDEKNETAPQGANQPDGYTRQSMNEASEERQKGGLMGQRGMKGGGGEGVKTSQRTSDSEMDDGPAHKVVHGRKEPTGHEPEIDGAHQGSGAGREPPHFSNLGHGEREATISGAHQGQHGNTHSSVGGGHEAGGNLSKENARGNTIASARPK